MSSVERVAYQHMESHITEKPTKYKKRKKIIPFLLCLKYVIICSPKGRKGLAPAVIQDDYIQASDMVPQAWSNTNYPL